MRKNRMIGIKISDDSNLPDRLRVMSIRCGADYAGTLDLLLTAAEKIAGTKQLSLGVHTDGTKQLILESTAAADQPADKPVKPERDEQINRIESRLAYIEGLIVQLIDYIVKPEVRPEVKEWAERIEPAGPEAPKAPAGPEDPAAPEAPARDAVREIIRLADSGMGSRQIAAWLNQNGIKTLKGKENWNPGTVHRIIKRK